MPASAQHADEGVCVLWPGQVYDSYGFASRDADPRGPQVFIHVNQVDGSVDSHPAPPLSLS